MSDVKIRRALLSVYDKSDIVDFARNLNERGIEILSTGGTRRALEEAGIAVIDIASVTNFPEMMDGRVKTLHPKIHGGLLALRDNSDHIRSMEDHGILGIDLVVCNLYPFEAVVAAGADFDEAIENIDIGGPAMTRAAAKNHAFVTVIVDPNDYAKALAAMDEHQGGVPSYLRRELSAKAFARTAAYDSAVSAWYAEQNDTKLSPYRTVGGILGETLRYGENPHQWAGFYHNGEQRPGVATAHQVQGKKLSYNNINDTDAAFELVGEFDPNRTAAVAIIKHANPCGVAEAARLEEAYHQALLCDQVSAFGGIIACNQPLDGEIAKAIIELFTEVIIAPGASDEALAILAQKPNLRLLLTDALPDPRAKGLSVKSVAGGLLVQGRDNGVIDDLLLKVVTKREPSAQEMADLKFAFRVAKHVKSNTIVYAKNQATVGIGAGQMSRIDAARIAARKAEDAAQAGGLSDSLALGSVVASDAFFPFSDGLLVAVEAGATAVIQPGGSMRDEEVIAAADEAGLAMIFTGMRHFRH